MDHIATQATSPAMMNTIWLFFLVVSILVFILGVGLLLRLPKMLSIFSTMSRWVSLRKAMKPLSVPHFIEPVVLKRPILFGLVVTVAATASFLSLRNLGNEVFQPLYQGAFATQTVATLAGYTRWFLLVGNLLSIMVGLLMIFAPGLLTKIESYTDMWCSVRKITRPVGEAHVEVDHWVLVHPTVLGVALVLMSLGLAASVIARL